MNWFKETWWLVKQLFTTTKNKDKVQYKHMDHYPFSGYSAMSWCGYILTKKKESDIKTTTWNHENIHLQQAENKGSWLKYYTDYVWEWIKGNPITYPAYRHTIQSLMKWKHMQMKINLITKLIQIGIK